MQAVITLSCWDEANGMTIMDDGTKAYWAEGRSSQVLIVHPDGKTEWLPAHTVGNPVIDVLTTGDMGPIRRMTGAEQREYRTARS